jgi:hypothetical protein
MTLSVLGLAFGVEPVATVNSPPAFAGSKLLGSESKYVATAHPATNNKIEGWRWDERIWAAREFENSEALINPIWDPLTSGITSSYFQSGIGDGRDLELESVEQVYVSGLHDTLASIFKPWIPVVRHGWYYDYDQEHYLFSDQSKTEYVTRSGVEVGLNRTIDNSPNQVALNGHPKVGTPVQARQWGWNRDKGKYTVAIDFNKVVEFTGLHDEDLSRLSTYDSNREAILWDNVDITDPEIVVTYSGVVASGYPTVVLNNQYVQEIGGGVLSSGLDALGNTTGEDNERFYLSWSPVDRTMSVDVYTYTTAADFRDGHYTQWEGVPIDSTFSGLQVGVDFDLGFIEFGDATNSGLQQIIPSGGDYVGAHYWRTVAIDYEPEEATDLVRGYETNLNPIYRKSGQGFVYLATEDQYPARIELTAVLPLKAEDSYGPLYIGNAYAPVIATVYSEKDELLEDQEVTFQITSTPVVGHYGGSEVETTGTTNANGEARAFYHPPSSIDDIGEIVTASGMTIDASPVIPSGATETTTFRTESLIFNGTENDVFLYQVETDDPIMGIVYSGMDTDSATQTAEYYRGWFEDQGIYGPTGLVLDGDTPETNAQAWEASRRMLYDLVRPSLFGTGPGKKTIVSALDSEALNPHTFEAGAISPVQPAVVDYLGDSIYDSIFDTSDYSIPLPSGTVYGYFLISPSVVTLQAYAYNSKLKRNITSNEIEVSLDIPPYAKGLWEVELLNSLIDDEISPLLTAAMEGKNVPLGWRIRSSNVTLAGALNGVTFLDLNKEYNVDFWDTDEVPAAGLQITISGVSS